MGGLVGKSGLLGERVGSTHEKRKVGCVRAEKRPDRGEDDRLVMRVPAVRRGISCCDIDEGGECGRVLVGGGV